MCVIMLVQLAWSKDNSADIISDNFISFPPL